MGADDRIVPAIKQALSMLRQAREALFFAQCPAAVGKVRVAIKSTESALRTANRRVQSSQVAPFRRAANGAPISWRRIASDDAPGSQIVCAPSRALPAPGADYRVNFRDGNESAAYCTDNLEDAVNTAVEMARKRAV
jgi:hypothetical protein